MVTLEEAKCSGKKWFDAKRCKKPCCDDSCDFLNLGYDKDAINQRIEYEQLQLKDLMEKKRCAKDRKDRDSIDVQMFDKVIGVMIMQEALIKDFGVSAFKSVFDMMKVSLNIKKLKKKMGVKL